MNEYDLHRRGRVSVQDVEEERSAAKTKDMAAQDSFFSTAKAGWSEVDITPPLGLYLGGRGMRLVAGERVKGPLIAQVLLLEDLRGERLALVSLDLIGLSIGLTATLQTHLSGATGAAPEAIILNTSHTHSGPFTQFDGTISPIPRPQSLVEYDEQLVERVVACAGQALAHLAPATVSRRDGHTAIGINRRVRSAQGEITMGPNPDGLSAPGLLLLEVIQTGKGDRCIAFSASCHPIIDCGWNRTLISPDFPGVARDLLRERLNGAHIQFFQATCGNIRPARLAAPEGGVFRACVEEDTAAVGSELANDVESTLSTPAQPLDLRLSAATRSVRLPVNTEATPGLAYYQSLGGAYGAAARYWMGRDPVLWSRWKVWPIGFFTLAENCRVAWFGGEPLAEWVNFLREKLADPKLIVWGYGGISCGYLPMDTQRREGGYETTANFFRRDTPWPIAIGVDELMGEAFQQLVCEMK